MKDSIKEHLKSVNFIQLVKQSKNRLKEQYKENIIFRYEQGLFKADKDLILFIKLLKDLNHPTKILIDINDNPVEVIDLDDFLSKSLEVYYKAVNQYNLEFKKIQQIRSKEGFIEND